VVPKGPAEAAGLRVDDLLLALAGERLGPASDLDRLLAGTAGKAIEIAFRRPADGEEGAERTGRVTPLPLPGLRRLLYAERIRRAEERVREASAGSLRYLHLTAMDPSNLQRFQQAVLDLRENGGGNIHEALLEILTAKPYLLVQPRGAGRRLLQPALHWNRPVVVLVNERSFSDAEVFAHGFQALERGKVVGVPTPGGVIGTTDVTLSDGTRFRIPRVGMYALDGTRLEGRGVTPDIVVGETWEDRRAGRDPQLDRAVATVLAEAAAATAPPRPRPGSGETAPAPAEYENPLADARVGEWLRYRSRAQGSETIVVLTVVEVTEEEAVLEQVVRDRGEVLRRETIRRPRRGPVASGRGEEGGAVSRESRRVGERELDCVVVSFAGRRGTSRHWFSNEVPATGLVRRERGGSVVAEVIDWGGPGTEPPAAEAPGGDGGTGPEGGSGG
jgi:tricorn protease